MYDKTKEKMNELNYESAFTDKIFMSFLLLLLYIFILLTDHEMYGCDIMDLICQEKTANMFISSPSTPLHRPPCIDGNGLNT